MKAPIWAWAALPVNMVSIICVISEASRSSRRMIFLSFSVNMTAFLLLGQVDKIAQDAFADGGHDGFRVKLDAFGGVRCMPEAHDFTVLGFRGDFQAGRQVLPGYGQRMIAHGGKGLLDVMEQATAVGRNGRGLAVHDG